MNKMCCTCSSCGHLMAKSAACSQTEMVCPKCGARTEFEVVGDTIFAKLVSPANTQKRVK